MKSSLLAFLLIIALGPSDLAGQGIRKGSLQGRQVRVLDTWHATFGADARRVFSKYGIRFGSNGADVTHVLDPLPLGPITPPRPEPPHIRNSPPEGSQADLPLVIDFRLPVRALALVFFADSQGTTATVSGFNAEGALLGTLEYAVSSVSGTDGEIESLAPEGISKLVVKFDGHQTDEEIGGEWAVEFVDPLLFSTVVPQVGDGLLGHDESLTTSITILNLSNTNSTGEARFYDPLGQPLPVPLTDREPATRLLLQIPENQSLTLSTRGISQPALSGYAVIDSTEPLQVTVHFRTLRGGRILSEVSGEAAVPRYSAKGSFERYELPGGASGGQPVALVNTGIALVNLSEQPTRVLIAAYEHEGSSARGIGTQFVLSPRTHYAQFLSEIFPPQWNLSSGVVSVSSEQPLGIAVIRTGDGVPLSILPLGSLEEE